MLENAAALQQSRRVTLAFAPLLHKAPLAAPELLVALDFQLGPVRQIVLAGTPGAPDTLAMLRAVRRPFLPDSLVILADGAAGQAFFAGHIASFKDLRPLKQGKATA